jgi:hypothetical protein
LRKSSQPPNPSTFIFCNCSEIGDNCVLMHACFNEAITICAAASSRYRPKHLQLLLPRKDRFLATYRTLFKWLLPSNQAIALAVIVTHLTATQSVTMTRGFPIIGLQLALRTRAQNLPAKLSYL